MTDTVPVIVSCGGTDAPVRDCASQKAEQRGEGASVSEDLNQILNKTISKVLIICFYTFLKSSSVFGCGIVSRVQNNLCRVPVSRLVL